MFVCVSYKCVFVGTEVCVCVCVCVHGCVLGCVRAGVQPVYMSLCGCGRVYECVYDLPSSL